MKHFEYLRSRGDLRLSARLLAGACFLALTASPVLAQVERNLPPPVEHHEGNLLLGDQNLAGSTDETPLGANLSGIVVLGPKEEVSKTPAAGIAVGDIGPISHGAVQGAIQPFVGKPISRKLISDVEAAVARVYRAAGYPFVSITIPPHDAGAGILQLRVVEFRMGRVGVQGGDEGLAAGIRTAPGDRIEARALEEDLDWINRNPYRRVQGVFAPGDDIGTSKLTLQTSEDKPWQVFGGYSNTGTAATGYSRAFIGAGAVIEGLNDTLVSYQLTGSTDFWSDPGSINLSDSNRPEYLSHSARIVIPTFARQAIEITPSFVSTSSTIDSVIRLDNDILEVPVMYRSAISNILPGVYLGDISAGVEFKHLNRTSYFTGTKIGSGGADLFQFALGWSDQWTDVIGQTSFDLEVRDNPGSVMGGNTDAKWNLFSAGRVTGAEYAYVLLNADRSTNLGSGMAWNIHFSGLYADQALPDTEQLALGGLYGTRSFTLDDGVVDKGLFLRNELRLPQVSLIDSGRWHDNLSPFVYVDYGVGQQYHLATQDASLVGIGIGADYQLAENFSVNVAGGNALTDGIRTHQGDWNAQVHLALSY